MKGNLNIEIDKKTQNLKAFKEKNEELDVLVKKWKKKVKIFYHGRKWIYWVYNS